MKLHSIVGLITNSSTELFTVKTSIDQLNFELVLKEIWYKVSEKPFPFIITNNGDEYTFDAGYYWGFIGYEGTADDPCGDNEFDNFCLELAKVFPDYQNEQVG